MNRRKFAASSLATIAALVPAIPDVASPLELPPPKSKTVVVKWEDGETNPATVISEKENVKVLEFQHEPGEEYEFERRGDFWFEINNNHEPVTITEVFYKRV